MKLMTIATTMPPGRYVARHVTRAYWWRHAKPLDTAIGLVLTLYRPGRCHGRRRCRRVQNTHKTQLLASHYQTFLIAELSIFVTQKDPLLMSLMQQAL